MLLWAVTGLVATKKKTILLNLLATVSKKVSSKLLR